LKRSETGGDNPGAALLMKEAQSLNDPDNKQDSGQRGEMGNVDASRSTLLSLDVSDEELLRRFKRWQDSYKEYYGKVRPRQQNNEKYWKGRSYGSAPDTMREYGASDNVIFESFEALLPLVTREEGEPVVEANGPREAEEAAATLGKSLVEIGKKADAKMKFRQASRDWGISLLGAVKIAWDSRENRADVYNVLTDNLELDPTGRFEGARFAGGWVIEHKVETAEQLAARFPEKEAEIMAAAKGNRDAFLRYSEAWTDDLVFWKLGGTVLDKRRNVHWNWEEDGGKNFLPAPAMPYAFMWNFSFGKQPHDETSLIEQSIPLQDIVNKRLRQIDKNADDTNNGWVFSNAFSEESGARALAALRRGGAILAPTDSVDQSVRRLQAPPLASFVVEDMMDKREQIRNLFGIRGSTASGITSERTVRGKIEIKGADADRAQPIVEHVEQMAEWTYSYLAQMVYVYYTQDMLAKLVGQEEAARFFVTLQTIPFSPTVYVKPGSTIPKDPLMRRNEAIDLFNAGALDPVTMFERLDFPNPEETAQKLAAWKQGGIAGEGGAVQPVMPPPGAGETARADAAALPPLPPISQ
jgi:hypothetical protein